MNDHAPMAARKLPWRRIVLAAVSIVLVVGTFAYFLPKIADYRDVWGVLKDVSPAWLAALFVATLLNLLTFAPPWMVALPGLRFRDALALTQVSTALSIVVPGGAAVGIAGSYGILRRWGFASRDIGRAVTLVSLWNQFANLSYPIIAVFLLTTVGGDSALLATAAFIGVGILGVAVAAFGLVLYSERMASDIGDVVAQGTNWAKGKLRRPPVTWDGTSFGRFRDDVVVLLRRRWHLLTLSTYVGTLTVFLVLLFSLRACGVPAAEVSLVEAFAAWSLARLLGSIPITPGGIGVVELGLTGALLGFGGANAGVVAAVLVYRFLTMAPTVIVGLAATTMLRGHQAPEESPVSHDVADSEPGETRPHTS
jgi:putative heme transporter